MKKKIYISIGIVLLVGAFVLLDVVDHLVIFLLVGALPGASWSVPPLGMLGLMLVGMGVVAYVALWQRMKLFKKRDRVVVKRDLRVS